jgi:hypothetical protein
MLYDFVAILLEQAKADGPSALCMMKIELETATEKLQSKMLSIERHYARYPVHAEIVFTRIKELIEKA